MPGEQPPGGAVVGVVHNAMLVGHAKRLESDTPCE